MSTKLNTGLKLFCPRRRCPCYHSLDNNITKDGVYRTKNDDIVRQMFYCAKGKHRFSETGYCDLFGKHGSFKDYQQICKLSCYGLSTDTIADVLLKDPQTIAMWQRNVSKKTKLFHDWMNFELGSRTTHTTTKLVKQIKHTIGILSQVKPLKITTDKLAAYQNALQSVFNDIAYVYLQIVKKRVKMSLGSKQE